MLALFALGMHQAHAAPPNDHGQGTARSTKPRPLCLKVKPMVHNRCATLARLVAIEPSKAACLARPSNDALQLLCALKCDLENHSALAHAKPKCEPLLFWVCLTNQSLANQALLRLKWFASTRGMTHSSCSNRADKWSQACCKCQANGCQTNAALSPLAKAIGFQTLTILWAKHVLTKCVHWGAERLHAVAFCFAVAIDKIIKKNLAKRSHIRSPTHRPAIGFGG